MPGEKEDLGKKKDQDNSRQKALAPGHLTKNLRCVKRGGKRRPLATGERDLSLFAEKKSQLGGEKETLPALSQGRGEHIVKVGGIANCSQREIASAT